MNYSELKRQILREIRGSLSQMEMSRKLGYSYNQMGKWETDVKRMRWNDFVDCCRTQGVDLEKPFQDIFVTAEPNVRDPKTAFHALKSFHTLLSVEQLAQSLHTHPSVVKRWATGAVAPDVEVMFRMMDLRINLLSTFVGKIVDVHKLEALKSRSLLEDQVRENFRDPALITVWLALRLVDYCALDEHSDEVLAARTGLSVADVIRYIDQLLKRGYISRIGRKYETVPIPLLSFNGDRDAIAFTRAYWANRSLQRYKKRGNENLKSRPNLQSFYTSACSKAGMIKITERLNKAHEEIARIVERDNGPEEEIRIVLIEVFSPDDVPFVDS